MKLEKVSYLNGKVTIDPNICNEKPIIRGKRFTVHTILDFLGAGESQEEILRQYPSLEKEDISACLTFTNQLTEQR